MFKVLKEGKLIKTTVIYKDTCKKCGCEFEFDSDYITKSDKSLDPDLMYKCPYCGKEITKKYDQIEKREIVEEIKPEKEELDPTVPPYPSQIVLPTIINNNPCEGCHIYEDLKKGIIRLDDSCYWCQKNPYKVTYVDQLTVSTTSTGSRLNTNTKITLEGAAE